MAILSCRITSAITARTAQLSWVQDLKMCANVSICNCPPSRLVATVKCHGIPRLPNQSVWLSLYFRGRYFIAQSWTIKTDDSSISSKSCTLAPSWLTERRRWDFHANIAVFAFLTRKTSSSFVLDVMFWLCATKPSLISFRVDANVAQRSHTSLWSWSHVAWNEGSFGSLKAYDLQWSATVELWETWTCNKRLKKSYN